MSIADTPANRAIGEALRRARELQQAAEAKGLDVAIAADLEPTEPSTATAAPVEPSPATLEEPPPDFWETWTESWRHDVSRPDHRTEQAAARRFVAQFGGEVRYVPAWGKWLVWDGKRWKIDDGCRVESLAKQTADGLWGDIAQELQRCPRDAVSSLVSYGRSVSSANGLSHVIQIARSDATIVVTPDQLDRDGWLLNCGNGTLDLRTGKLRLHSKCDLITKAAEVEYREDADCPTWLRCIRTWMNDDQELIDFLRRLAGYWLTGEVREHVLPVFHGPGSNGKSVFVGVLETLLGPDYAMHAPPDLLMLKKSDAHPTERADLFGRRLVSCMETQAGRRLNEALVKELTGGDRVRARRMREDFWEFEATHKFVVGCNHKPIVDGTDNGIWRRLRLVPWTRIIPEAEQDHELPQKLRNELDGILLWCVMGCREWQAVGLGTAAAIEAATSGYRTESDILGQWLDDRCVLLETARTSSQALRDDYVQWCSINGPEPVNSTVFGRALSDRGFQVAKIGGRKVRFGIGLKAQEGQ